MAKRAPKTYGSVRKSEDGKAWVVSTAPYIMLRFRRLFVGATREQRMVRMVEGEAKAASDELMLVRTKRTARDLEWFLDRYPMVVSKGVMQEIEDLAAEHRKIERSVDGVMNPMYVAPSFTMAIEPRDYQRQAAALALATRGLLLGDDVGLGKTVTAIAMLTDPRTRPALVVTLTHLTSQWEAELHRFMPGLRVHVVQSGMVRDLTVPANRVERRVAVDGKLPYPDVIVINYHKLKSWAEALGGVMRSVVFDEVQELRHFDSNKYLAAESIALQADFRLGLTATPVYNYGGEIHSILRVLTQGEVGTRGEFVAEWCGANSEIVDKPRALGTYLREEGLMLRRTRTQVGRELPPLQQLVHKTDADIKALDAIDDRVTELARIILRDGKEDTPGQRMEASSEISWRLRMATGMAKAPYVADFVTMLAESEKKVVLYGWHRAVYEVWREKLKHLNPVFYTGEESTPQKDTAKHHFMRDPQCRLMILSLRAGAGLDGLQGVARTVVFGELDWSPGVHEQCVGRVYRDGQSEPVVAYYLVSDYGADPVMADVLQIKDLQARGIRDPDADLIERSQVDPDKIKKLAADYIARHRRKE
jgi:SNF2 family DNA or RNA helicase